MPHIHLWEPCCSTKVPDGPQAYSVNVLWLQKGAQIGMSECSQSLTLTKNVGKVSFSVPHLLHSGLSDSPSRWRCLLRVLCPVRRPVTTLDCILLKDKNLALTPGQDPKINSRACLWVAPRPRLTHAEVIYEVCCWLLGLNPDLYCKGVNNLLHCKINAVICRLIWLQNGAGV